MFHVLSVVLTLSFSLFMHIYITIERERESCSILHFGEVYDAIGCHAYHSSARARSTTGLLPAFWEEIECVSSGGTGFHSLLGLSSQNGTRGCRGKAPETVPLFFTSLYFEGCSSLHRGELVM